MVLLLTLADDRTCSGLLRCSECLLFDYLRQLPIAILLIGRINNS